MECNLWQNIFFGSLPLLCGNLCLPLWAYSKLHALPMSALPDTIPSLFSFDSVTANYSLSQITLLLGKYMYHPTLHVQSIMTYCNTTSQYLLYVTISTPRYNIYTTLQYLHYVYRGTCYNIYTTLQYLHYVTISTPRYNIYTTLQYLHYVYRGTCYNIYTTLQYLHYVTISTLYVQGNMLGPTQHSS